jgi:hypothetical protein
VSRYLVIAGLAAAGVGQTSTPILWPALEQSNRILKENLAAPACVIVSTASLHNLRDLPHHGQHCEQLSQHCKDLEQVHVGCVRAAMYQI